jgi:hypothetical protein
MCTAADAQSLAQLNSCASLALFGAALQVATWSLLAPPANTSSTCAAEMCSDAVAQVLAGPKDTFCFVLCCPAGGYMVGAGTTCKYLFDLRPGDVYWCTADCGWITGHTYLTYGPLLNGVTNVLFGSTPAHPDAGRCWRIVEKYNVSVLQTLLHLFVWRVL